jgi:t-SNARE complex subunit (syntaxin)
MSNQQALYGTVTIHENWDDIIQERDQLINQISEDVTLLSQIFEKLNTMVINQGESVNFVEDTVSHVRVDLERAKQVLSDATKKQKRKRDGCCWILTLLIVAVIIITTVLVLSIKL